MQFNSISTRTMLILVSISIIIVLVLGGLWLHTTQQILEKDIYSSDSSDSQHLAEYVRMYLNDITHNLNVISTYPDTVTALKENDLQHLTQIANYLNQSSPQPDAIYIIDNEGHILSGTLDTSIPNITIYPWYDQMAAEKKPYLTGIYHSYSVHEYAFAILTPIKDDSMVYGRVIAVITPKTLHDSIMEYYHDPNDNIIVVDGNGHVISSDNLDKLNENKDISAYSPIRQVINGEGGVIEYSDTWDGQQRISAFQPVSGSNWGVIVSTPKSIEYKQLNDLIGWIIAVLVVFIVAVSLLGYIVSRYITNPIIHLSGTMRQVSRGTYDLRAKMNRSDEIGELATTFNTMMDRLEDTRQQSEMYLDLMGHDINNMNQVALGYLQLASEKIESGEPLKKDDDMMIRKPIDALEESSRLIDNIRKLQKAKTGEMLSRTVDISAVLKELKEKYSHVPERDIQINIVTPDKCEVSAHDLIKDLFSNLIGNAIKHSDQSIPLVINLIVKLKEESGRISYEVAVEDNGPGIPDDVKEKLFSRFSRGRTKAKGSGLGLYLVKSLAESYHGTVHVEDRVKGDHTKGARFIVTLPAMPKE